MCTVRRFRNCSLKFRLSTGDHRRRAICGCIFALAGILGFNQPLKVWRFPMNFPFLFQRTWGFSWSDSISGYFFRGFLGKTCSVMSCGSSVRWFLAHMNCVRFAHSFGVGQNNFSVEAEFLTKNSPPKIPSFKLGTWCTA